MLSYLTVVRLCVCVCACVSVCVCVCVNIYVCLSRLPRGVMRCQARLKGLNPY